MFNTFYSHCIFVLIILLIIAGCNAPMPDQNRQFFQLKIYTHDNEDQVDRTELYLETAFLPALKRIQISDVGVFKPRLNEGDTLKQIFVLIPFSSLQEFQSLVNKLSQDEKYLADGRGFINASHENPPYSRIESILLHAFEDMAALEPSPLESPREDRIYELRSYESATQAYYRNKVEMFNGGGEIKLFDRLGFNAVFYGDVISGKSMPNLMYMTTFSNQETRDSLWKEFVDSPEWQELITLEKYKNNVSHIDIHFLYPTEYSDY